MLYKLEVENFYSIRDQQVLDLSVDGKVPDPEGRYAPIFEGAAVRVPKVIALYGANASGKTTVLRALEFIITMARDMGIETIEKRITRDEMYCADEAFFTGTAAEITPIRELDDRAIGNGTRGPITEKLQNLFFDVVAGKSAQYRHWLHPV